MKRLREENINTPVHFDRVWALEGQHAYDAVRLRAFLDPMRDGMTFLDVGAGWHGIAEYACLHGFPGHYTAIDFSREARRRTLETLDNHVGGKLVYEIGDALHLPYADDSFDVVGCGELVEHFHDPRPLVAQLMRVCKPGGRVIISTLDAYCPQALEHTYPEHLVAWDRCSELIALFEPESFSGAKSWVLGNYFLCEVTKA